MGQHHPRDPGHQLRLVVRHPGQLGDRERGDRDRPAGLGPRRGAEPVDQRGRLRRRLGVVPELRRSERRTVVTQHHQPVLLTRDRDGGHIGADVAARRERDRQGLPPRPRVLLAAGRLGRRVRRPSDSHHLPGVDVADLDLGRLGRGVDPCHQRHQRARSTYRLTMFSIASWAPDTGAGSSSAWAVRSCRSARLRVPRRIA